MEFYEFRNLLQENFNKITEDAQHLFEAEIDKDEFWNLYLDSFPPGTNEVYRKRREFDCSCCRHFIKAFGNVVVISDGALKTIWDFDAGSSIFQPVINELSRYIKSRAITSVFVTKESKVGTNRSFEQIENNEVVQWNHFYLELPSKFVSHNYKSINEIKGEFRDTRNVFKHLDEITTESVETVLELIAQGSLYKGEEWKSVLAEFLKHKKLYEKINDDNQRSLYAWENSIKVGAVIGRIRNHSIGVLLVNISENMDLDEAVRKYEAIVAPTNYKRPKAIFTKKMLEDAKKTIEELGYMDSLERRHAKLDDISVNNILFSNKDSATRIQGAQSIFDDLSKSMAVDSRRFSHVEEVPVDIFVKDILPTAREVEAFVENKHIGNFVSLIAPSNPDAKNIFKWNNSFSWAYAGNITDSNMKENVKSAGGSVDGVLRFSIQWNDDDYNPNDFDAHCIEPDRNKIYYGRKQNHNTTGELDVDIINPVKGKAAVENITWSDKSKMKEGVYRFFVHNYSHRGGRSGFKAEIEFDGNVYAFEYAKKLRSEECVNVAEVTFSRENGFSVKELIPSSLSSREVWGINTNQFVPVLVLMYSPNYWDLQDGVGHRHYFFMLKNCINSESPNGFYNEFLQEDLMKHKRVFEAIGGRMAVENIADQLSGLGFSATKRSSLLVKVKGSTERVIRVNF